MKVNEKRIIVTGAASGIGRELTKQLINKGSYVDALDINLDKLEELKSSLNTDKLSIYQVDMGSEESLKSFKEIYDKDLDGIINNAGIIQPFINVEDLDMNIIDKVMQINFYGPLILTKMFLKHFKSKKEAHIVNIDSMGGFFPFPGQTMYGASKAALKLLTEGLYSELLDTNVKVTLIFPGAIDTDISKNSNIEMKKTDTKMKILSASKAASLIIEAMEKDKFKAYVGTDSKVMNLLYKINDKWAIKMINKKMKEMM
jgi:short-subunit dehydrogenase